MAIQNSDDQYEVDFDELDFQANVAESSYDEPLPSAAVKTNPLRGRKSPKQSKKSASVEDYKQVLLELQSKISEVCSDESLTSEQKTDLISYASKQAGHSLSPTRIVQILLEHHSRSKYGSDLILINQDQGNHWFEFGESHIIEDLITKGELNIIGGLSGAAKTNFTAMFLSTLLNTDRDPHFLGFKVNRELVNDVFFIGLDGGRNVYTPIFRNTGLINESGAIPHFNFIPNESGWGITSSNLDKLEVLLKQSPQAIVVVDSLLAATSGSGIDENSALMAARIMDLKLVCERHGATPIVLAHQKKECTQDFAGADSLRGHSSIPAFAGQIITLNFLDQKSKVNGRAIPDRKSPKRRLVAGHRGTPIDLLVELDFEAGAVKNLGEFYDALFSLQCEQELEEEIHSQSLQGYVSEMSQTKQQVFEALRGYEAPVTQSTLINDHGFSKGTLSKRLKELQEDSFRGNKLVTEYDTADGKQYEIVYAIKQEMLLDY